MKRADWGRFMGFSVDFCPTKLLFSLFSRSFFIPGPKNPLKMTDYFAFFRLLVGQAILP
jgi:hypothetical protein